MKTLHPDPSSALPLLPPDDGSRNSGGCEDNPPVQPVDDPKLITLRPPNPFVGPRPLQVGERLYGRERETVELCDLIIGERILLLYAPSGAGKTSLVEAGLRPALADENFAMSPPIRLNRAPPGGDRVFNRYLFSAMQALEADPDLAGGVSRSAAEHGEENFADYLADRTERLRRSSSEHAARSEVLLFDQFEEILTVGPVTRAGVLERAAFFAQLGKALRDRSRWALFAMREDYLAALDPYLDAIPTRLGARYRIDLLQVAAAARAIQKTAEYIPEKDPRDALGEISGPNPAAPVWPHILLASDAATHLAQELSRVRADPTDSLFGDEGRYVEPLILQVVCRRWWDELPWADLPVIDGRIEIGRDQVDRPDLIDDALRVYYDTTIQTIADVSGTEEHDLREWITANLITPVGLRGRVRRGAEAVHTLSDAAVAGLVGGYLVRQDVDPGETWLELTHDRLLEPIRASNGEWFKANLAEWQSQARLWALQPEAAREKFLLDNADFKAAKAWIGAHPRRVPTLDETRFLDASELEQSRAQSRRFRSNVLLGVVVLVLVIAGVAVYAAQSNHAALELRRFMGGFVAARLAGIDSPKAVGDSEIDRASQIALQAYEFERAGIIQPPSEVTSALNYVLAPPSDSLADHHLGQARAIAIDKAGGRLASAGEDGKVLLWPIEAGRVGQPQTLAGLPAGADLWALAFSPDGQRLAAGGCKTEKCSQSLIAVWDLENLEAPPQFLPADPRWVRALAFDPRAEHRWLFSGGRDGSVQRWDLADPTQPREIDSKADGDVLSLAFTQDGAKLAFGTCFERNSNDNCLSGRALVFDNESDISSVSETAFNLVANDGAKAVSFNPDGTRLAIGTCDVHLDLARCTQGRIEIYELPAPVATPQPDAGTTGNRSIATAPPIVTLKGHGSIVTALAWTEPETLLSSSWDASVLLWDPYHSDIRPLAVRWGVGGGILSFALSSDGNRLATAGTNGDVSFGEFGRATAPAVLGGQTKTIWAVALSRDGTQLATGSDDGLVLVHKQDDQGRDAPVILGRPPVNHCQKQGNLPPAPATVSSLAWDADGTHLAVGYTDGTIRVWKVEGTPQAPIEFPHNRQMCVEVLGLAFDPTDAARLVSVGWDDGTVRSWNLAAPSDTPVGTVLYGGEFDDGKGENRRGLRTVAFSQDGALLAIAGCTLRDDTRGTCGTDGLLLVWDSDKPDEKNPEKLCCSSADLANVALFSVAFGSSGDTRQWLAAGARDGQILRWRRSDDGTFVSEASLRGHSQRVGTLAISLDGAWLFSGSDDGTVLQWPLNEAGLPALVLRSPEGQVWSLAVDKSTARPHWIATGGNNGAVRLWSLETAEMVARLCQALSDRDAWLTESEWATYVPTVLDRPQLCTDVTSPTPPPSSNNRSSMGATTTVTATPDPSRFADETSNP